VSYPAYKQTIVSARGKELALRNKPDPEASGEAGAAALDVQKQARDNLQRMRESIQEQEKHYG
jgi:hypothetical protein